MWLASLGDDRADAARPQQTPVLVVVVAAIGEERVGSASGPADDAGHGRNLVQQRQQLRDVVAVSAGQRDSERDALSVGEDVVLAARPCPEPSPRQQVSRQGWMLYDKPFTLRTSAIGNGHVR